MGNYDKHIIWSNTFEETQYLKEELRAGAEEEMSEEELVEYTADVQHMYLEDIIQQLSRLKVYGEILAIADLGFWNGRTTGYKLVGADIEDVFAESGDYLEMEWYVDKEDFKATLRHHDNVDYVTYRVIKEDLTEEELDLFLYNIYNNKVTEEEVDTYTYSLKDIVKKELSIA